MPKPRQVRTDSLSNSQRILASANVEIAPPVHVPLTDDDWPYWHSLIEEYARADWTPHMLEVAALLARSMARLEAEQRQVRSEGAVLERKSGPAPNPRNRVVSTLTAHVLAYRRSLALTGRAKAGSSEDAAHRRVTNRRTERRLQDRNDDLLA